MRELADFLNKNKVDYIFCGCVKIKEDLYYVGSYTLCEPDVKDLMIEAESNIQTIDFVPVSKWGIDEIVDRIDSELENLSYHSFPISPSDVVNALPDVLTDEEKVVVVRKIFDFL